MNRCSKFNSRLVGVFWWCVKLALVCASKARIGATHQLGTLLSGKHGGKGWVAWVLWVISDNIFPRLRNTFIQGKGSPSSPQGRVANRLQPTCQLR